MSTIDRLTEERCADAAFLCTLKEIADMALDEEEEDRPNPIDALRAILLLSEAAEHTTETPPKPHVAAFERACRVTWEKADARLVLSVGRNSYIYWETSAANWEVAADPLTLARSLEWIARIEPRNEEKNGTG